MSIKHCVYKYVYEDEIIYIGKTDSSLRNRVNCHSQEEKFQKYLPKSQVFYMTTSNPLETEIYEKILINKYQPILNVKDKIGQKIARVSIQEKWEFYKYNEALKVSCKKENKEFNDFYKEYIVGGKLDFNSILTEDIFDLIKQCVIENMKEKIEGKEPKLEDWMYFTTKDLPHFLYTHKNYSSKYIALNCEDVDYRMSFYPVTYIKYNRVEREYTVYYNPKESFIFFYFYTDANKRKIHNILVNLKNRTIN